MSLLDKLGILRGTDKSSLIHNYCGKYERYLPFSRVEPLTILEIGVLGGESLRMWKDYFCLSDIVGIDIDPSCKQHEEERIKIEIGSQDDSAFLSEVGEKYKMFDIILDDGSHQNSHVIFSFEHLFKYVKPGGVYIVEDCCTSYWEEFGGGVGLKGTMVEYFKDLILDVNLMGMYSYDFESFHARREDKLIPTVLKVYPESYTNIESINFLNGIIIITKRNVAL